MSFEGRHLLAALTPAKSARCVLSVAEWFVAAALLACLCVPRTAHAQLLDPLPRNPSDRLERLTGLTLPGGQTAEDQNAGAANTRALPSDAWSKLVYQRYVNHNWEIFFGAAGGTGHIQLTNNHAPDVSPKLNHGATTVVFTSSAHSTSTAAWEVYSVNVDGTHLRRLTWDNATNTDPAWSSDGSEIVYTSQRSGNEDLFVMNTAGSQQRQLTNDPGADREPAWSRSNRIAWVRINGGAAWLMLMNADGSNAHAITGPLSFASTPVWDMTGDLLAYTADLDGNGLAEIALLPINADGSAGAPRYFKGGCPEGVAACDYIAGGWFSTGGAFFATRIDYVVYQNQLYVANMTLLRISHTRNLELAGTSAVLLGGIAGWPDWNTTDITPPELRVRRLPRFLIPDSIDTTIELYDDTAGDGGWYRIEMLDANRTLIDFREGDIEQNAHCVVDERHCTIYAFHTYDLYGKPAKYVRMRARDRMANWSPWYDVTPEGVTFYEGAYGLQFVDARQHPVAATVVEANQDVVYITPQQNTASALAYMNAAATYLSVSAPGFVETGTYSDRNLRYYGPKGGSMLYDLVPADNRVQGGAFTTTDDATSWQIIGGGVITNTLLELNGTAQCVIGSKGTCEQTHYAPVSVTQSVTLSPTLYNPTLSFMYALVGYDPLYFSADMGAESGALAVSVGDGVITKTEVYTASVYQHTTFVGWQAAWMDLSPWNGSTITVTLTYTPVFVFDRFYDRMFAWVDNVAVGSWSTPVVTSYSPTSLAAGVPGLLTVAGANLSAGATLRLDDVPLSNLHAAPDGSWQAEVPPITTPGRYSLFITSEQGATAVIAGAVRVGLATYVPHITRDFSAYALPAP